MSLASQTINVLYPPILFLFNNRAKTRRIILLVTDRVEAFHLALTSVRLVLLHDLSSLSFLTVPPKYSCALGKSNLLEHFAFSKHKQAFTYIDAHLYRQQLAYWIVLCLFTCSSPQIDRVLFWAFLDYSVVSWTFKCGSWYLGVQCKLSEWVSNCAQEWETVRFLRAAVFLEKSVWRLH